MYEAGERVGRFLLEKRLGEGSYGAVFVARDTSLDQRVALKILRPSFTQDPVVRERFRREIVVARRVVHPGVCRVFDLHEEGGAYAISMALVEGRTLFSILKEERQLPAATLVPLLRALCKALQAAHDAGVIHR